MGLEGTGVLVVGRGTVAEGGGAVGGEGEGMKIWVGRIDLSVGIFLLFPAFS